MTALWIGIAILTVIAVAFVIVPLLSRRESRSISANDLQISLYHERLSMLRAQRQDDLISFEEYDQSKQDLEQALLDDIPEDIASSKLNISPSPWLALAFFVLLPAAGLALYHYWGFSSQLNNYYAIQARTKEVKAEVAKLGTPQKVVETLQKRLKQNPDSARGWYLLGKIYFGMREYEKSVDVLSKSNELKPNDPETMLALAQSLFFANKQVLTPRAQALLDKVLKATPNNHGAMNLIAVNAFIQHNYPLAIKNWEILLADTSPDSETGKYLMSMIAQAQEKLKQKPVATNKVKLQVAVSIEKSLAHLVKPDDTLFIYAIAAQGPKMPLAVIRKQAKDLPIKVTLSDKNAMIASRTLADVKRIRIVARISKSGEGFSQAGDLQGQSEVISNKHKGMVNIVINRKITK